MINLATNSSNRIGIRVIPPTANAKLYCKLRAIANKTGVVWSYLIMARWIELWVFFVTPNIGADVELYCSM